MKKEFKRSSEFSSRSSRPESFTDVSRGREVIVRRESLSTTSSSIDPRQVKERYVLYLRICHVTLIECFLSIYDVKFFTLDLYVGMNVPVPRLTHVNAKYGVPRPRRIEALEIVTHDTAIVSSHQDLVRHVSFIISHARTKNGFNIQWNTQHLEHCYNC